MSRSIGETTVLVYPGPRYGSQWSSMDKSSGTRLHSHWPYTLDDYNTWEEMLAGDYEWADNITRRVGRYLETNLGYSPQHPTWYNYWSKGFARIFFCFETKTYDEISIRNGHVQGEVKLELVVKTHDDLPRGDSFQVFYAPMLAGTSWPTSWAAGPGTGTPDWWPTTGDIPASEIISMGNCSELNRLISIPLINTQNISITGNTYFRIVGSDEDTEPTYDEALSIWGIDMTPTSSLWPRLVMPKAGLRRITPLSPGPSASERGRMLKGRSGW